jgi:succinylarginine dihydrolase
MGQLEDECLQTQTDPVTMVVTCVQFRDIAASMSAAGANASARFFDKLEGRSAGTVNHSGFMSPSELRLLSEWLDIGAQYYNDPFTAPEN